MSRHDPGKYLYDIINCCEFIMDITSKRTVEDYKNDRLFRSALERELQIIGEAMLQLDRVSPEITDQIGAHRNIIGFRNVLVHGYDSLDPDTVWDVVRTKVPVLLAEARQLL